MNLNSVSVRDQNVTLKLFLCSYVIYLYIFYNFAVFCLKYKFSCGDLPLHILLNCLQKYLGISGIHQTSKLENKTYFPKRIICWKIVSALTTRVVFLYIFPIPTNIISNCFTAECCFFFILRTWNHIKINYCTEYRNSKTA